MYIHNYKCHHLRNYKITDKEQLKIEAKQYVVNTRSFFVSTDYRFNTRQWWTQATILMTISQIYWG